MSMNAWVYQKADQVAKLGADKASWYVGWYEPNGRRKGKSFGAGPRGKERAERQRRRIEEQLMTGTYEIQVLKTWADFKAKYERDIIPGLAVRSRSEVIASLAHFERIIKPARMIALNTEDIDRFIGVRRQERGKKKGELISPATVNKDLRHIKAAFKKAKKWGYIRQVPDFDFEREGRRLPTYVTGEHFTAIYAACDKVRLPDDIPNVSAADWWRALIVTAYMTGWRISDLLGFRREDLDLEAGTAITRFEDNKGKRDDRVQLHPVAVEHLRRIASFDSHVLPWNLDRRTLDVVFRRIQEAAGIHLSCPDRHEHTPACHVYGFHDLRRAFATMNADRLSADALQALMRHKSYQTTQVYINLSRQLDDAVASLHVPDVLRKDA